MRLSSEGFGDIQTIKNLDSKTFFELVHYVNFKAEYAEVFRDMNKKGK